MAKPPTSLTDLNNILSEKGKINDNVEKPVKKVKKAPEQYIFQMAGNFPIDPNTKCIHYPPLSLSNSQMVYDEGTGRLRQARLIRGCSTMWQDEQDKLDPNYVKRNPVLLNFSNGRLVVNAIDVNTVKYLMLCSDFEGCEKPAQNRKTRYRLLDTETSEAKELERKKQQRDAEELAWKANMEDLKVHYVYLGGNLLNGEGEVKSEAGLRGDYVKMAEEKHKLFMDTINNPIVKTHMMVRKASEKTHIIYIDGQYLWADTKAYICQVPQSYQSNPAGYLAELMLTNDGKEIRSRLETMDK